MRELEYALERAIAITLDRTRGNIKEAAGFLGIDRSTLYEKVKRYEIERATSRVAVGVK